jgi:ribosomal protein S1
MPEDRPSEQEWELLQNTLPRGLLVKGRVTAVAPFGVFVDIGLDPRIPVLLEIIHFEVIEEQPGHRIRFPEDYPEVEDEIEACILAYSVKPHDIRLTQLSHLECIHTEWQKKQSGQTDDSGSR